MNSDENSDDGDGDLDDDDGDKYVDVASIADDDEHEAAAGVHRPRHRPFLFPQHPQVHGGCHNFSSSLGLELRNYTQNHGCRLTYFYQTRVRSLVMLVSN